MGSKSGYKQFFLSNWRSGRYLKVFVREKFEHKSGLSLLSDSVHGFQQ